MAIISLSLSDDDYMLIKKYSEFNRKNVSEFIRQAVIEKIEDEIDLVAYDKANTEYKENPVTYTSDEVKSELGLL